MQSKYSGQFFLISLLHGCFGFLVRLLRCFLLVVCISVAASTMLAMVTPPVHLIAMCFMILS